MKFSEMPYKRIDFEKKEAEFKKLLEDFKAAKSGEEQFEIHKAYYKLNDEVSTSAQLAFIRSDIDTTDAFYSAEKDYYDEKLPEYNKYVVAYKKLLYASEYRDFLEEKIGSVAFKNIELSIKSFSDALVPLIQEENALVNQYDRLIAGAKIDWEGQTLNLSLLTPYLTHADRQVRRRAWKKFTGFFESAAKELDTIYDALVKNRTAQAQTLGYKNFVELGYYRMNRNCYDKDMVENFRRQIKTYFVPLAEKVHERRRVRLGVDKLSYVDNSVYFAQGNPAPFGTPEEILLAGQKMYEQLSPETKEFMDFMMENELFDVLGRKTKRAGGYMTYIPEYHSPFVFANFNGTSGDVDVITHECGHAFQGYLSGFDPIQEHSDITMETAEIHSMSMEFFTNPWMDMFFGDRSEDFLKMQLEDAIAFIPYGCMVDEFQHIVYENPQMTPDERHQVWRRLERVYKPHLDYEDNTFMDQGRFWQKQLHIYGSPFYYIDYVLAQVCALQFKIRMDEDYKEAWNNYLKLCKLSASGFFTDMIRQVGLDVPFEDGCVEKIVKKLEEKFTAESPKTCGNA